MTQFCDLQLNRPQIIFLVDPFNEEMDCLKPPLITDEAAPEVEMIDLCEEDQLKPGLREGTTEFWMYTAAAAAAAVCECLGSHRDSALGSVQPQK